MLNSLYVYSHYLSISIRSQIQYRAAFIMLLIGNFLSTGLEFFGVFVLLTRFKDLQGWSLSEIALFYSIVNISYALSDSISRGFELFPSLLKSGEFDRFLLRPRSTVLQLAAQELSLRRFGRLAQGLFVLFWSASTLHIAWSLDKILLAVTTILGGACFFYGLIILQATLTFWTIESLEIMNIVTYGGVETAQYPLAIYQPWFRRFFTFVIPLACVSYYPVVAILNHPDPLGSKMVFQWLSPLIGILFLLICLQLWELGVRHYNSTGS
ncbi:ABC transporter permease [Nostoc sp.]|uniref:ABC transporter permease n=1 Tax=Nostoc sp. TaxID=1180 RepID=UPI002FFC2613